MENKTSKLQWYVVSTTSGYENKVRLNLETKIKNLGLQEQITDIYIPTRTYEVTDSKGKVKVKEEKLIPNYVFLRMEMNDKTWHCVFETENVINFVGPDNKPAPLSAAEVEQLGVMMPKAELEFKVGDYVQILAAPMTGFEGKISAISDDGTKATVNASVFGRETPVEIEIQNIKKL